MVNLNQLRCFYMAVKHGSIVLAAEKMFVTAPAVTMQIKQLESRLGIPLLRRKKNSITLAEEAEELYRYAAKIFSEVENLEAYLDKYVQKKIRELRVGTHHMIARAVLPGFIESLKAIFPQVDVKVVLGKSNSLLEKLLSHQIHSAVLAGKPVSEKINTIPLFEEEIILVAAADSAFITAKEIALADLEKMPILMHERDTTIYEILNRFSAQAGINLNIVMNDLSGDVILSFLRRDIGLAFLLRFTAQESIERGELIEIRIVGGLPQVKFCIAFLKDRNISSHLLPVVSWLEKKQFERSDFIV